MSSIFAPEPFPAVASTRASGFEPVPWTSPSWGAAVAALLLLGVALRLGQVGAGLRRLRTLRREAIPVLAPPWLLPLRDEVAPRAALARHEAAGTPATFGLRRPVVLLPPVFESMDRERQEAVALHELLHARRADWLPLVGEEILKAVLFFHPVVHWLVEGSPSPASRRWTRRSSAASARAKPTSTRSSRWPESPPVPARSRPPPSFAKATSGSGWICP